MTDRLACRRGQHSARTCLSVTSLIIVSPVSHAVTRDAPPVYEIYCTRPLIRLLDNAETNDYLRAAFSTGIKPMSIKVLLLLFMSYSKVCLFFVNSKSCYFTYSRCGESRPCHEEPLFRCLLLSCTCFCSCSASLHCCSHRSR